MMFGVNVLGAAATSDSDSEAVSEEADRDPRLGAERALARHPGQ